MSPTGKFWYWDFMGGQRKIFWGVFEIKKYSIIFIIEYFLVMDGFCGRG
jgi:hypothetical protein